MTTLHSTLYKEADEYITDKHEFFCEKEDTKAYILRVLNEANNMKDLYLLFPEAIHKYLPANNSKNMFYVDSTLSKSRIKKFSFM